MDSKPQPSLASNFEVKFNREIAWTITYEDAQERFMFVFEPGKVQKSISWCIPPLLNNKVLNAQDEATRSRIELACERTKEFLQKCG